MKRIALTLAALAAALLAASAAAAPRNAALVIHHQARGCHAWSLNGGPNVVRQDVSLSRGGSLRVTNNDLMIQELVKTSGPAVKMKLAPHMENMGTTMHMGKAGPYAMAHMGAQLQVTFSTAGTYRFTLMDRGDYYSGIKTIGPDNVPTLTVHVA